MVCSHLACLVVGLAGRMDVQRDQPRDRFSRLQRTRHCAPPGPLQMLVGCMCRATTGALWRRGRDAGSVGVFVRQQAVA